MHEDRIREFGTSEVSDMPKQRSPCCQVDLHWIQRAAFHSESRCIHLVPQGNERYSSKCTQCKCKHPSGEAVTHQELRHPNGSEQG